MERCEPCWEMARLDSIVRQGCQAEFRYRTVRRVHHWPGTLDTGELSPHMDDPYRL